MLRTAASFGVSTAAAVVLSGMLLRRGGVMALVLPPLFFGIGGYLAGQSIADRRASRASAIGLALSGTFSLLAIVSTQASIGAGFIVAFGIAWAICGFTEAIALFDAVGRDAPARRRSFLVIVGIFTLGGLAGGLLCLAGLTRGGANDPIVDALLIVGLTVAAAAGGGSLGSVTSGD
jgi:hypothetical protein